MSYKEIAEVLQVKYYKGGNVKTRQLNEIQRYYKLDKVKAKYLIVSKHSVPLDVIDNRQSIYYDDLEVIILYALQNRERTYNTWSITEALLVSSLVNSNYKLGKKDIELTADILEVDKDYLNNFYNSTRSRFKGVFDSTLKRMANKKLIDYKEVLMVCKRTSNIKLNDLFNPVIDDKGNLIYTTNKVHTEATINEREYILKVEKGILNSLNCSSVSNAIATGQYYTYRSKVNLIIKDALNIEYYYNAYSIIHNKDAITQEISELKQFMSCNSLNSIKLDALNNSKDKVLNNDLDNKQICIDILISSYPNAKLKHLIKNLQLQQQEQDKLDNIPF